MVPEPNANEVEVTRLTGPIDAPAIAAISERIRRAPSGKRCYVLDCAGATDFTGNALAKLAELIVEVRGCGSKLVLVNFSKQVQETLADRLLEALVHPAVAEAIRRLADLARLRSPRPRWQASLN
jgi:anti-anti-sigma regulatory factor